MSYSHRTMSCLNVTTKAIFVSIILSIAGCGGSSTPIQQQPGQPQSEQQITTDDQIASGEPVKLSVEIPDKLRTIAAVNYTSMVAVVSFNSGAATDVTFSNAAPVEKSFGSIILDQLNTYNIKWYEIVDGVRLLLTEQNGSFIANSTAMYADLDATHNDADFDWDNDGISNFNERQNNTCPWVMCDAQNGLIQPELVTTVLYNVANNHGLQKNDQLQWTETSADGVFNWIQSEPPSRTIIYLKDLDRGYSLEVNLKSGEIWFNYNSAELGTEYFLLYFIQSAS